MVAHHHVTYPTHREHDADVEQVVVHCIDAINAQNEDSRKQHTSRDVSNIFEPADCCGTNKKQEDRAYEV